MSLNELYEKRKRAKVDGNPQGKPKDKKIMDIQDTMLMNFMEQSSDPREIKRAIAVRMRLKKTLVRKSGNYSMWGQIMLPNGPASSSKKGRQA